MGHLANRISAGRPLAAPALALILALLLSACAKPQMPMEAVVDGFPVTLGRTTMADLTAQGWTAELTGRQETARKGDPYIAFYYLLSRDGGDRQFQVRVYVPWTSGNDGETSNVTEEQNASATQGVVCAVGFDPAETGELSAVYNSVPAEELTAAVLQSWGAARKGAVWTVDAAGGTVAFSELGGLQVTMSLEAFQAAQEEEKGPRR